MPETSQYTDLLIPAELKVDALRSLDIDVTDATQQSDMGGSYQDAAILAIRDVTEAIESYLDRKLMVRKWDVDIQRWQWEENKALGKVQHLPGHWPVVQVETAGVTISNDGVRLLAGDRKDEAELYAGYKRRDQALADLQGELPALTETPDELPYDIRRVAMRLVMYELTQALQNTYAVSSVTKTAGGATAEITKARADVYAEELARLSTHRRLL